MDCTASMRPYIDEAKKTINEIITDIRNSFAHLKYRVGFVGYRDLHDGKDIESIDFTNDIPKV